MGLDYLLLLPGEGHLVPGLIDEAGDGPPGRLERRGRAQLCGSACCRAGVLPFSERRSWCSIARFPEDQSDTDGWRGHVGYVSMPSRLIAQQMPPRSAFLARLLCC